MSFEFSPEAVLFDIQRNLVEKTEERNQLNDIFISLTEEREPLFDELMGIEQGTPAESPLRSNVIALDFRIRTIDSKLNLLNEEILNLKKQIPVIEVDVEAKRFLNIETRISELPPDLFLNFQTQISELTKSLERFDFAELNVNFPKADSEKQGSNIPLLIGAALVGALIL